LVAAEVEDSELGHRAHVVGALQEAAVVHQELAQGGLEREQRRRGDLDPTDAERAGVEGETRKGETEDESETKLEIHAGHEF
jgi:hypothetical protein